MTSLETECRKPIEVIGSTENPCFIDEEGIFVGAMRAATILHHSQAASETCSVTR